MSPTDYAQTKHARDNREAKARTLARAAWDQGLDGDVILAMEAKARRALARAADVQPPTDPGDTWPMVLDKLAAMEAFAVANPGHPAAARAGVPAQAPAPALEQAPPAVPDVVIPKGWPELVAKHPPLTRPDARCCVCRRPAITASGHQWRCADHPPQPGETGARLDWTPRYPPEGCGHGRCYCTRCPTFTPLAAPQAPRPDDLYR